MEEDLALVGVLVRSCHIFVGEIFQVLCPITVTLFLAMIAMIVKVLCHKGILEMLLVMLIWGMAEVLMVSFHIYYEGQIIIRVMMRHLISWMSRCHVATISRVILMDSLVILVNLMKGTMKIIKTLARAMMVSVIAIRDTGTIINMVFMVVDVEEASLELIVVALTGGGWLFWPSIK
jgi:hypothetical protein